jgi:hypothetical protein
MASSSFTLPRWFGGKKKSKETYRIQEEGDESIYQNIGDDGGPDYSKRALPRTPSEEERLFSPPPTLGDVVKARARLRKTVSVDEGIGYNVAAWNRYAVSRDRRPISQMALDSLPEASSGAQMYCSQDLLHNLAPTYANVPIEAQHASAPDDTSSSSNDSVFYGDAKAAIVLGSFAAVS